MEGANYLRHSDLKSDCTKSLLKMIIEWKDLVKKILFKERLGGEFQPYRMVSNIAQLEKIFVELQQSDFM